MLVLEQFIYYLALVKLSKVLSIGQKVNRWLFIRPSLLYLFFNSFHTVYEYLLQLVALAPKLTFFLQQVSVFLFKCKVLLTQLD